MSRTQHYEAHFVESFPTPMEPGKLYISAAYSTAGHICPCGCGREVVTKLSPARWSITFDGEVSLGPSVATTGLPCNSHYFITRGQVDWHCKLTSHEAIAAQDADRRAVAEERDDTPTKWLGRLAHRFSMRRR